MKKGDWVVRQGFLNFWPGQIISEERRVQGYGAMQVKVFWLDKQDWEWHRLMYLEKIPPLKLLAMQAK